MVQLVWHSYVPSSERTPEIETGTGAETDKTEWKEETPNRKREGMEKSGKQIEARRKAYLPSVAHFTLHLLFD